MGRILGHVPMVRRDETHHRHAAVDKDDMIMAGLMMINQPTTV